MSKKIRQSAARPLFWHQSVSWFCVVFGIMAFVWLDIQRSITSSATTQDSFTQTARPTAPERIVIPSAQIDQTLLATSLKENGWNIAAAQSNYLLDSARPGENSNVVVYGHNLWNIFGKLKQVQVGQTIKVETADREIWYEITSKQVVWPTETRVIQPTDTETLTIFTCTGLFDSQRLVIQAKPINSYYRTKTACAL